ncbi:MAG TPA: ferredoxin--NADP reductase [Gemmataceae bacterium]|nr:ferredoxin--NADP reductase [Gemmataceae bacterium]
MRQGGPCDGEWIKGGAMTPEQLADLRRKHYNATLVWERRANPDLAIMRIRPDFPLPVHKAGQYSTLGLGNWEPRVPGCQDETLVANEEMRLVRRAYSISCSVLDEGNVLLDRSNVDWLEFYIVLVRESDKEKPPALTPRLFFLKEGDRLFLGEKITGHYTLDSVQPGDAVVFLGTGTGEAPHNYMLWELLCRGYQGRTLSACCVRYRRDLAYVAIHEELMRRYPNYTYLSLTTREVETIKQKVYIQDLITSGQLEERLGAPLDPARTHVFLCGNPKMIGVPTKDRATGQRVYPQPTGVVEILERRGFQADQPQSKIKGNVHFEEYW